MNQLLLVLRATCCLLALIAMAEGPDALGAIVNVSVGAGGSFSFSPSSVTINQGDTVRWTWGSNGHNVICENGGTADPFCGNTAGGTGTLYNSGNIYTFTYNRPGTYPYYCAPHTGFGMVGTVTVNAVGPPNTPPAISTVGAGTATIPLNSNTGDLPFTVADNETAAGSLGVSAVSQNTTLLPGSGIAFGGSGANRTVKFTPAAGQSGSTTVTVTVSDGVDLASTTFFLTVSPANTAPIIQNAPGTQSVLRNTVVGPLNFGVLDAQSPAGAIIVTGLSDNLTLVPLNNIVFGGGDSARTITITPAQDQTGTAHIGIVASDGALKTTNTFTFKVNTPPMVAISSPPNGTTTNFPSTFTIAASPTDTDGTISSVVFLIDALPVKTNFAPPYTITVTNLAAGAHALTAKATDNSGEATTSAAVTYTVNPFTMTAPVFAPGQFQLSYPANVGMKYAIDRSSDLKTWTGVITNTAGSAAEAFTDTQLNGQQFYFYRVRLVP